MTTRTTSQPQQPDLTTAYHTYLHYTALTFLFASPILIATPPRKLDFYTFALGGSWILSVNHLMKERMRERYREASAFVNRKGEVDAGQKEEGKTRYEIVQEALRREEVERRRRERERGKSEDGEESSRRGMAGQLEKVWMGGEKRGWKERRLAEEQERIANGEGYGSMIMDQIWEVWNWGREKGEEVERKDREAVRERRRAEEFPEIGKGEGRWGR